MRTELDKNIVFFDEACILCNRSVQFILTSDRSKSIYISPLQSELGKQMMKQINQKTEVFNTILYWDGDKLYKKSSASLRIARDMKTWVSLMYIFILVPNLIRDGVYNWISRNRFKWFGRTDKCMIRHPRFLSDEP